MPSPAAIAVATTGAPTVAPAHPVGRGAADDVAVSDVATVRETRTSPALGHAGLAVGAGAAPGAARLRGSRPR